MSGVSYGLSLELNIEPSDYLKGGQVKKIQCVDEV